MAALQHKRLPKRGEKAAQWSGFLREGSGRDGKENCGLDRVGTGSWSGDRVRVGDSEAETEAEGSSCCAWDGFSGAACGRSEDAPGHRRPGAALLLAVAGPGAGRQTDRLRDRSRVQCRCV